MSDYIKHRVNDWMLSGREEITDIDYANHGDMSFNELNERTKELADQELAIMMDSGWSQNTNHFEETNDNYQIRDLQNGIYNDKGMGMDHINDYMLFLEEYGKDNDGNWGTVKELGPDLVDGGISIPRDDAMMQLGDLMTDHSDEGAAMRNAYNKFRSKNNKEMLPVYNEGDKFNKIMLDPNVKTVPLSGQSNYQEVIKSKYGKNIFDGLEDAHNATLGGHYGNRWRQLKDKLPQGTMMRFRKAINLNVNGPTVDDSGNFIFGQPSSSIEANRKRKKMQARIAAQNKQGAIPDPDLPIDMITEGSVLTVRADIYIPYGDDDSEKRAHSYWSSEEIGMPVEIQPPKLTSEQILKIKNISDADMAAFAGGGNGNDTTLTWERKIKMRPDLKTNQMHEEVYYVDSKNLREWTPNDIKGIMVDKEAWKKKWNIKELKNSRMSKPMTHNTGSWTKVKGIDADGSEISVKVPMNEFTVKTLGLTLVQGEGEYKGYMIKMPADININDMLDPSIEAQKNLLMNMNSLSAKKQQAAVDEVRGKMYGGYK